MINQAYGLMFLSLNHPLSKFCGVFFYFLVYLFRMCARDQDECLHLCITVCLAIDFNASCKQQGRKSVPQSSRAAVHLGSRFFRYHNVCMSREVQLGTYTDGFIFPLPQPFAN